METNYTLREQIILRLFDKTLEYSDIFDINDVRIARIHHIADTLSAPPANNNIPNTDISLVTPIEAYGLGFCEGAMWADENRPVDCQQVRIQASIAAMQGICANEEAFGNMENSLIVRNSVELSDLLVDQLKE